jgi:hypothetical protein
VCDTRAGQRLIGRERLVEAKGVGHTAQHTRLVKTVEILKDQAEAL